MTRSLRVLIGLLVGSVLLSGALCSPVQAATKDQAKTISDGIICPCSCGEILTGCTCETGKAMRANIEADVKAGKTKDQIEAALVAQYGEVILGAPKAKGFNLLVWVAPVIATVAGLLIASFILVRWRRRNPAATPAAPLAGGPDAPLPTATDARADALRARAEEELRGLQE